MSGYYTEKLAGERLRALYESAPVRIRQYLEAEIRHVAALLSPRDEVLELGCGYGRVMREIAPFCDTVVGIDTSLDSLKLGRHYLNRCNNCYLCLMNAVNSGFAGNTFDLVLCIQNGISAFHVDQVSLVREALRVTKAGGMTVFSTYAEEFWDERLRWFEQQAKDGFIGPIDYTRTGNGRIVCTDQFTATTVSAAEFNSLADLTGAEAGSYVVDGSSLFCKMRPQNLSGR